MGPDNESISASTRGAWGLIISRVTGFIGDVVLCQQVKNIHGAFLVFGAGLFLWVIQGTGYDASFSFLSLCL
jgi:hypothetical protein